MKRLLAYLFIVLGLGLTFSVSAESEEYICFDSYNETEVKVYLETRNNFSYDVCVGKKQHWATYVAISQFKNDITVDTNDIQKNNKVFAVYNNDRYTLNMFTFKKHIIVYL